MDFTQEELNYLKFSVRGDLEVMLANPDDWSDPDSLREVAVAEQVLERLGEYERTRL